MKNVKELLFGLFILVSINGCIGTKTLTKEEIDTKYTYTYTQNKDEVLKAIAKSIEQLDWTLLDIDAKTSINTISGFVPITDKDSALTNSKPPMEATNISQISLRTNISAFSFGAYMYITLYTLNENVTIKLAASTSQIVEKEKLPQYLEQLHLKIEENLLDKNN